MKKKILSRWFRISLATLAVVAGSISVSAQTLSFLAFGDWGRDGAHLQREVAVQMGKTGEQIHSQFVVALGDNFYDDGVPTVNARQWKTSFEDIYTAPALQKPWYVVLGNHDYHTNAQAEIDYTAHSSRWKLPSRYYTFTQPIDANTSVQFFMLDSSPFLTSYRKEAGKYGDVLTQDPQKQTAWLEAELAKSTAQWKIVCAHHPVYSCSGKHGDTEELILNVAPLLEKYHVQVFLNGHEHDMQHLQVGTVNYFCSGAGSQTRVTSHDDRTRFSLGETSGFLAVTLTPNTLKAEFIDDAGKSRYVTDVPRSAKSVAK